VTPRALIVDDERAECELFADALRHGGFDAEWILDPRAALDVLAKRPFDVVVTDLNMPAVNGVELCRRVKQAVPHLPVVVVTAFGSIDGAVEAMRAGAYDFVTKPFDVDTVALVLKRAVDHHALWREVDALRRVAETSRQFGPLLGTSESIRRTFSLIDQIKDGNAPVLVSGESGTGKDLVAREIHLRSPRAERPFVVVRPAELPEALLAEELFGSDDALPTGRPRRASRLSEAGDGTLVIDEVGDLSLELQAALLGALEQRRFRTVDGAGERQFGARLVATTRRDLEAWVEQGRFREDLLHCLSVFPVEVPPLRARGGDVLLLAESFLGEIAARNDKRVSGFTAQAASQLQAYDWPGNVRELRNCVERAVTLTREQLVGSDDLPQKVREHNPAHLVVVGDDPSEIVPLEQIEQRYILKVVEACRGNKSQAARVLGIGRKTLYRRLEKMGLGGADEAD